MTRWNRWGILQNFDPDPDLPLEMCRRTAPQAPTKVATLALGHHEVIHGETLFAWSVLWSNGAVDPRSWFHSSNKPPKIVETKQQKYIVQVASMIARTIFGQACVSQRYQVFFPRENWSIWIRILLLRSGSRGIIDQYFVHKFSKQSKQNIKMARTHNQQLTIPRPVWLKTEYELSAHWAMTPLAFRRLASTPQSLAAKAEPAASKPVATQSGSLFQWT